jgi:hypothetical protein
MSAASQLLDRLGGVWQSSPGGWLARCPTHQDSSLSLCVRELGDGRVPLHDCGGCETGDILAELGNRPS